MTDPDIDKIIDNFDFEAVAKVMDLLDWHWYIGANVTRRPTIDEMKARARDLLVIAKRHGIYSATGGFVVDGRNEDLRLQFVAVEW